MHPPLNFAFRDSQVGSLKSALEGIFTPVLENTFQLPLGPLQRDGGRGSPAVCDSAAHSSLRTTVLVAQRWRNHEKGL